MSGLAADWRRLPLSELGALHCGQSPSSNEVNRDSIGTPYFTGPEQWNGKRLEHNKWTTNPKRTVPNGCIFITVKGAGVGTIFPGAAGAIGRDIYAFEPSERHSAKFIEYALKFSVKEILKHAVGDIPGLSKRHIIDHQVNVPTLEKQRQIVEEIEKHFSRLDEAITNLNRAKANLKRYQAAVLKAAVEGRLVETEAELARRERRTYETGEQLLQRILETRRSQWKGKGKYKEPAAPGTPNLPGLPQGWAWARLDSIADLKGGITVDSKRQGPMSRTVPYLRVANVQRGYLDLSEVKTIIAPARDIETLQLHDGDILFNEGGDRDKLGRGWIWEGQLADCIHQNHVFRARLVSADIAPKLVSWWGNSFGKDYFQREGKQTTNLASINLTKLGAFPVPVPPNAEQQRIVAEIDRRLSLLHETEAQVDVNLKRAARIRQSILAIAFTKGLNVSAHTGTRLSGAQR